MASFMPEYTKNNLAKKYVLLAASTCVLLFSVFIYEKSYAANSGYGGFKIINAETKLKNSVFQLSANMSLSFSADALEALRSGVPLIVLVNIEVLNDRNWWWDKTIAELEQGYLLLYHALSEKYIIHNLNSGAQNNYVSLNTALSVLGQIRDLPILDKNLLNKDSDYYIRLRTYLDIESLPAPMRPIAYISSQWQLESDWFTWPLEH